MRPTHLTLQAFGSYGERTEISFERTNQNLFLITGDTGAGKSTISMRLFLLFMGRQVLPRIRKMVSYCKVSMSTMRRSHLWSWSFLKEMAVTAEVIQCDVCQGI